MNNMIGYPGFRGENSTPQGIAGHTIYDNWGRKWKYVQVSEALVAGNLAKPTGNGARSTGTVTTIGAINGTTLTDSGEFTTTVLIGSSALGESFGHRLRGQFDTGTGGGQSFSVTNRVSDNVVDIVVESGGTTFSDDAKMQVATDTSTTYVITDNSRVEQTETVADFTLGVAQWDITADFWSYILIEGPGYALFDTSVAALDAGDRYLVPGAEDGYCAASTGSTAENERAVVMGRADKDMDSDCLIRCYIDTTNMWGGGGVHEDFGRVGEVYPTSILGPGPN
jgi:hypothetical protein